MRGLGHILLVLAGTLASVTAMAGVYFYDAAEPVSPGTNPANLSPALEQLFGEPIRGVIPFCLSGGPDDDWLIIQAERGRNWLYSLSSGEMIDVTDALEALFGGSTGNYGAGNQGGPPDLIFSVQPDAIWRLDLATGEMDDAGDDLLEFLGFLPWCVAGLDPGDGADMGFAALDRDGEHWFCSFDQPGEPLPVDLDQILPGACQLGEFHFAGVTGFFLMTGWALPSPTPSATPTGSPVASATPTLSPSETATAQPSVTGTATLSATATGMPSLTATASLTPTVTATAIWTDTLTPSPSATQTFSATATWTSQQTATITASRTASITRTPSLTATWATTATPTAMLIVEVQQIMFDHAGGADTDAADIRVDLTQDVPLPEWSYTGDSHPAALVGGSQITVKAKFVADPVVNYCTIWAEGAGSSGILGELEEEEVTFTDGMSDWVEFTMVPPVPVGITHVFDEAWQWWIRDANGSGMLPMTVNLSENHELYVLMGAPTYPMLEPWTRVLDLATQWADGETENDSALIALGLGYYNESGLVYDGSQSHYNSYSGPTAVFHLTDFLDGWDVADCQDSAIFYTMLSSSVGTSLQQTRRIGGVFYTNPILAIGDTAWVGVGWNFHHIGWNENVYDDCEMLNQAEPYLPLDVDLDDPYKIDLWESGSWTPFEPFVLVQENDPYAGKPTEFD